MEEPETPQQAPESIRHETECLRGLVDAVWQAHVCHACARPYQRLVARSGAAAVGPCLCGAMNETVGAYNDRDRAILRKLGIASE